MLGRTSDPLPVLLLTSHMPTAKRKDKAARQTLRATTELIFDVICTNTFRDLYRLRHYLTMTPAPKSANQPTGRTRPLMPSSSN